MEYALYLYLVSENWIKECFYYNTTLVECNLFDIRIHWFMDLNKICKELGATYLQRKSVPQGELFAHEIKTLLTEMIHHSEPWKKMKLVVLGHGRIGKTTLLTTIHNILHPSQVYQVCTRTSYRQLI